MVSREQHLPKPPTLRCHLPVACPLEWHARARGGDLGVESAGRGSLIVPYRMVTRTCRHNPWSQTASRIGSEDGNCNNIWYLGSKRSPCVDNVIPKKMSYKDALKCTMLPGASTPHVVSPMHKRQIYAQTCGITWRPAAEESTSTPD